MNDPDDKTLLDELFGDASTDEATEPYTPRRSSEPDADTRRRVRQRSAPPDDAVTERVSSGPAPGAVSPVSEAALASTETAAAETETASFEHGAAWAPRSAGRLSTAPGCREIGLTTTGFVIFVTVDSIMMYAPFRTHGSTSLLPQAITLLLLAFGLGALLIWHIRGACRPVGIGMMLGWVFMTLISAGYFTGLNP